MNAVRGIVSNDIRQAGWDWSTIGQTHLDLVGRILALDRGQRPIQDLPALKDHEDRVTHALGNDHVVS